MPWERLLLRLAQQTLVWSMEQTDWMNVMLKHCLVTFGEIQQKVHRLPDFQVQVMSLLQKG